MKKSWYKSKTIWIAFIEIVAGLLLWWRGMLETGAPITGCGVIQIILRLITKRPVIGEK